MSIVLGLIRSFLFAYGGLKACSHLYQQLAHAVFHTNISFFESNTVGRLVNRFGKDSNTIDDSLPFIMNILLANTFLLIGSCFVIGFSDPPILLLLLIISIIYYRLQKFYSKSTPLIRTVPA